MKSGTLSVRGTDTAFRQMLRHDMAAGLGRAWFFYIPLILAVFFSMAAFYRLGNALMEEAFQPTFADYLLEFLKGMKIYDKNRQEPFRIPSMFILFHLYMAFLVARYPLSDLSGFGRQVILHARNRAKWWNAKIVWCIVNAAVFYLIVLLMAFLFSLAAGRLSAELTEAVNLEVSEVDTSGLDTGLFFLLALLLPFVCSAALSILELAVSLFSKPWCGFVAGAIILALSAYFCHPLLMGNYQMVLRSRAVSFGGVESLYGFLLALALLLLAYFAGRFRFSRYDILV